jgi:D-glycero-alpha-D-manno-heptose-7-phosphate kinase
VQAAHAVEVERLGQQSGVQDQWCAALGGVNFIEIAQYPHATVTPVPLAPTVSRDLERRLVLVYLGRTHRSTAVHEEVIARLKGGEDARGPLEALRTAARAARAAVTAGDLDALGAAMRANTDAQAALHPELVSKDAHRLIDVARSAGAVGWKVNGAGGEGGSITLLAAAAPSSPETIIQGVQRSNSAWRVIPITLAHDGLRVWVSSPS